MTTSFLQNAVWVIADAGVKGALLLALAGLACLVLRRASAAVRHQIWSLAFCGAVLLPVISSIIPTRSRRSSRACFLRTLPLASFGSALRLERYVASADHTRFWLAARFRRP